MSIPFFMRLEERAKESDSLLCVGLDPHPEFLSENTAQAAFSFCCRIIEATADHSDIRGLVTAFHIFCVELPRS